MHCMNRSIHGVVKDLHTLNNLNSVLNRSGLRDFGLSYVGGLSVLLTLGSPERVKEVMSDNPVNLSTAFSSFDVWKGEDLPSERIVSIRISGVPVHLRDSSVYDQIGGLFGKVVQECNFSWMDSNNSECSMLVLAPLGKRIEEAVVLNWEERSFVTWVVEDVSVWKPDLYGYNSSMNSNPEPLEGSDTGSDGDHSEVGSDADSDDDPSVDGDNMEDVAEEGEIKSPVDNVPVPENPVRSSPASHGGHEESPDNESMENVESLHAVHGETNSPLNFKKDNAGILNAAAATFNGGPYQSVEKENEFLDNIYEYGPTPITGLGKRNRAVRSPPSTDSMLGPPTRGFSQNLNPDDSSFDLNNPVSGAGLGRGEQNDGECQSHGPSAGRTQVAPLGVPEDPGDSNSGNPGINEEVQATAAVGLKVGINLQGFEEVTRSLIIGEEGRSGGLACLWNPGMFYCENVIKDRYFLALSGYLNHLGIRLNLVNVYASNDAVVRRSIWDKLVVLKNSMQGIWVFMGDFNEVRDETERSNSEFNATNANAFNNFILSAGLSEYNMGGGKFTYISDRGDKLSKLDRFLVCLGFLERWPTASVLALDRDVSDHRPILLSTIPSDFGHIPFRCYNSWMELPGFMELVKNLCHNFVFNGPADMALTVKLRWLKNQIKAWLKVERARLEGIYTDTKKRISVLEALAEERALEEEELNERAECINTVWDMDRRKQSDARQKSRARWALDGDENSAFYHNIINSNISNNRINGLMIDGVWNSNPVVIKEAFFDFFAKQFVEPMSSRPAIFCHNLTTLSSADADNLVRPFSAVEIKEAIWGCVGDRAPGPDGFNFKFIKKNWDLFQGDFIRLFQEFYSNGTINRCCASSFIALIPKINDPSSPSNFRPISLIGVVNKAISKVLVNRLRSVVGRLVSEEQSAFLAGRNISDGPLILNEVITWLKKAKKSGLVFKVDINKAYDSLNWKYLDSIMAQMNFPDRWRGWIMATLVTSRASVLVNGSPTMEFECSRGLRQGDPLSPFLFVLAVEALSGIMKKAMSEGIFNGLRCTSNGPVLSHLIYADDVVFLGEWSPENVLNLRRILRCFYLVSGLKVNLAKCSLFGVGVDESEVQHMADAMGCKRGTFPFKHLGLVVGANMNLIRNWNPVIELFRKRLSLWKAKNLSYGGRITLLKSVLNSLPTYFFSLYKAPAKVIDILEKLRRVFFWGGSDDNSYMSWMAWEKVIAPIEYGGLGFGSLRDANLAMLAKWWWRFKTDKDGLWRRVVWAVHHNSRSWAPIPAKVSLAGPWKQIVGIQTHLSRIGINLPDLVRCNVGCGSISAFWLDVWIGDQPLLSEFPLLFALEKEKLCKVSDRVTWGHDYINLSWCWKRTSLADNEKDELLDLSLMLCEFVASSGPDKWVWRLDNSDDFSVASIKQISATVSRAVPDYQFAWNKFLPKKVGIVSWRAASDRLPTRVALAARNIVISDSRCLLCGDFDETIEHLFVSCHFAQSVWLVVAQWCKAPPVIAFSLKDILDAHMLVRGNAKKKKVYNAISQVVIWCLWRMRNEALFRQAIPCVSKVVEESKTMSFHWVKNRSGSSHWSWSDWQSFNLIW
ncbi:putative RNA-directed DNA polymerase [Helianthus anomalus]